MQNFRAWSSIVLMSLLTAAACPAQIWSPRQRMGDDMAKGSQHVFGSWPLARYQFVDANLRALSFALTNVSMRPDRSYPYPAQNVGEGRSWTDVTLDVAATDLQNLSQTYSLNYRSVPTRCFRGSMSWPTIGPQPSDRRQVFPVSVPFSQPFVHAAGSDLLLDFQMQGGTLNNQRIFYGAGYRTEGYRISTEEFGTVKIRTAPGARGCVDLDAVPPFDPAFAGLTLRRSAQTHWYAPVRGKVLLESSARNLGRSTSFVGVLDLVGRLQGIPLGAPCQQLFAQLSPTSVLFTGVADSVGGVRRHNMRIPNFGLFSFVPALRQQEFIVQYAWRDTRSGELKLSAAASAVMPEFIPSELDANRVCIWGRSLGPWGTAEIKPEVNPVFRYN